MTNECDMSLLNAMSLDDYSPAALRQIVLAIRIKQSRTKTEYDYFKNQILSVKKHLNDTHSVIQFYQNIIDDISNYLKERETCAATDPALPR